METVSSDPHEATSIAMAEVTSAVIATSLVLISVFIPVSFFPGTTGILYKQFSLTIAFSIAISAFNALTLSPALAAILLRAETEKTGIMGFLLNPVERLIQWVIRVYARAVTFVVRIRYVMLLDLLRRPRGDRVFMYNHVPTAFIPQEDQSYFLIIVQTPPGASLSYTSDFADRVSARCPQERRRLRHLLRHGLLALRRQFAKLRPHLRTAQTDQRPHQDGRAVLAHVTLLLDVGPKLFGVPGGIAFAAEPPAVAGIGTVGGFQFILQDCRAQHLRRHRSRRPHARRSGPRSRFRPHRNEHDLHLERSATTRQHRSREGQSHRCVRSARSLPP